MVGLEGQNYSFRVVNYVSALRGTRQYWIKKRSRLIVTVDSLGMPTIFSAHSAADLHSLFISSTMCKFQYTKLSNLIISVTRTIIPTKLELSVNLTRYSS